MSGWRFKRALSCAFGRILKLAVCKTPGIAPLSDAVNGESDVKKSSFNPCLSNSDFKNSRWALSLEPNAPYSFSIYF